MMMVNVASAKASGIRSNIGVLAPAASSRRGYKRAASCWRGISIKHQRRQNIVRYIVLRA
jgi:hypothetical protein